MFRFIFLLLFFNVKSQTTLEFDLFHSLKPDYEKATFTVPILWDDISYLVTEYHKEYMQITGEFTANQKTQIDGRIVLDSHDSYAAHGNSYFNEILFFVMSNKYSYTLGDFDSDEEEYTDLLNFLSETLNTAFNMYLDSKGIYNPSMNRGALSIIEGEHNLYANHIQMIFIVEVEYIIVFTLYSI